MLAQAGSVAVSSRELQNALYVLLPIAGVSMTVYLRWALAMRARGGRVVASHFGRTDLALTVALGCLFCWIALLSFTVTADHSVRLSVHLLLADSAIKVVFLLLLAAFLAWRRAGFTRFFGGAPGEAIRGYFQAFGALVADFPAYFGTRTLSLLRVIGYAVLFLIVGLPMVYLLGLVMTAYRGGAGDEQQIVTFFRDQAKTQDLGGILVVFATASLIAPFIEELIFRGYIYATLKRFLGPLAAAVIASALFALVHANLNSLPGLFALAISLTVAYEWTGSLLVPMTMHTIFNSMSLTLMYVQATHSAP